MKKNLIRLLVFLAIFTNALIQFVSPIEARDWDFRANISVYQDSDVSSTGRCYGPFFTSEKNIKIEIYDMYYKDSDKLITRQDVENIEAELTNNKPLLFGTKLVNRVGSQPQVSLRQNIKDGTLYLGEINITNLEPSKREVRVRAGILGGEKVFDKKKTINIKETINEENCFTEPSENSFDLCLQINDEQGDAQRRCIDCFDKGGVWTAVGCIPQTSEGIISTIMEIGIIVAGAIVLIMILVGAFMLSTSQGDPKKTQEAKELITSAIIGLLFIIFSVTILQFIGVSVIRIPGFGEL